MSSTPPARSPQFAERLTVPLRWWVQSTMFLATVWLAFIVSMPAWLAWGATGVLTLGTFAMLLWIGAARVTVHDGELLAGDAQIPIDFLGTPQALDPEATHRVLGVEADARAYLLTRPYLKRAVKIPVIDEGDPTPYWLITTRHPAELVAALSPDEG